MTRRPICDNDAAIRKGAILADVFISYARADRATIERLAAALESDGYSVWWDRHIDGGAEFSKDIERELNAAKAIIVGWSSEACESRWVKDEASVAAAANKLVAICLDQSEPPLGFKQFHTIDFSKSADDALDHIKRSIGSKTQRGTGRAYN